MSQTATHGGTAKRKRQKFWQGKQVHLLRGTLYYHHHMLCLQHAMSPHLVFLSLSPSQSSTVVIMHFVQVSDDCILFKLSFVFLTF